MATQTVTASMRVSISITETLPSTLSSTNASGQIVPSYDWATGNAAASLSINQEFCKGATAVTLNSGASVTYTLTSLTDDAGRSKSFANGVRLLTLWTTSRTAGDYLTVGNAASNPWTGIVSNGTVTFRHYDLSVFAVGSTDEFVVTANSSEQLKITNAGSNPITFKLAVGGIT